MNSNRLVLSQIKQGKLFTGDHNIWWWLSHNPQKNICQLFLTTSLKMNAFLFFPACLQRYFTQRTHYITMVSMTCPPPIKKKNRLVVPPLLLGRQNGDWQISPSEKENMHNLSELAAWLAANKIQTLNGGTEFPNLFVKHAGVERHNSD